MSVLEADYIVNKMGGAINIAQMGSTISANTTFTGPHIVTATLIFSAVGRTVTVVIPAVSAAATNTAAAFFTAAAVVPAPYRPSSTVYIPMVVQTAAGPVVNAAGSAAILSTGNIQIYNNNSGDPTNGTFAAAVVVCGWSKQSLSWTL
jgi:hypothetical protein